MRRLRLQTLQQWNEGFETYLVRGRNSGFTEKR